MKGIYIMLFSIYPDYYKIGSSNNIKRRLKDFQSDSINLGTVELIKEKLFNDYLKAETDLHKILSAYRVYPNKEFFKGDLSYFILKLEELDSNNYLQERKIRSRLLEDSVAISLFKWMKDHIYNGKVNLSAAIREEICSTLQISNNALTNNLKTLKELGLISGAKGNFTIIGSV